MTRTSIDRETFKIIPKLLAIGIGVKVALLRARRQRVLCVSPCNCWNTIFRLLIVILSLAQVFQQYFILLCFLLLYSDVLRLPRCVVQLCEINFFLNTCIKVFNFFLFRPPKACALGLNHLYWCPSPDLRCNLTALSDYSRNLASWQSESKPLIALLMLTNLIS